MDGRLQEAVLHASGGPSDEGRRRSDRPSSTEAEAEVPHVQVVSGQRGEREVRDGRRRHRLRSLVHVGRQHADVHRHPSEGRENGSVAGSLPLSGKRKFSAVDVAVERGKSAEGEHVCGGGRIECAHEDVLQEGANERAMGL